MPTAICSRHRRPRPCPECGLEGYGGRRPGQGRKPRLRDPVAVLVRLEREDLEAALRRFPGTSRAGALRGLIQDALRSGSEAAAKDPADAPRGLAEPEPPAPAEALRSVDLDEEEGRLLAEAVKFHAYWSVTDPPGYSDYRIRDLTKKSALKELLEGQLRPWSRPFLGSKLSRELVEAGPLELSLEQCRLLRKALNLYQRSWKVRHLAPYLKRVPWAQSWQRQEVREKAFAENARLRALRERFPWR